MGEEWSSESTENQVSDGLHFGARFRRLGRLGSQRRAAKGATGEANLVFVVRQALPAAPSAFAEMRL